MDIVFVNTNSAFKVYQGLADKWSAIEPPTWSLLLAESCRAKGYGVAIIDAIAENLTHAETAQRVIDLKPRFCCFVTYGQQPNSGTFNMVGVYEVAKLVKQRSNISTISIGSHTSALPEEVLECPHISYVALNEGVYTLHDLLSADRTQMAMPIHIRGLGWRLYNSESPLGFTPMLNPGTVVPQDRMDVDLPGYAWDLLPYKNKPFDLYRAHTWHAEYQDEYRTPFAALYTSLGCQFKCNFCMINIVNRTNPQDGVSSSYNNMRFWSPELIIKEFDKLISYGVTTIRLTDEMFFLNKKYYEPLLKLLDERGYGKYIKMWSYSRVDTVNEKFLDLFRKGGIKWLALGIETANQEIRREITKGKFENINVRDVIKQIHNHDMYTMANYIFGHSNDSLETMQETLDLALELNTESANFYTAMALPGSPLYFEAKKNGWELPTSPEGWSFHSYECKPLPTNHLKPEEVLKFRDEAWHIYFQNPKFLELVQDKFGALAVANIKEQSKIKLKRKILNG